MPRSESRRSGLVDSDVQGGAGIVERITRDQRPFAERWWRVEVDEPKCSRQPVLADVRILVDAHRCRPLSDCTENVMRVAARAADLRQGTRREASHRPIGPILDDYCSCRSWRRIIIREPCVVLGQRLA